MPFFCQKQKQQKRNPSPLQENLRFSYHKGILEAPPGLMALPDCPLTKTSEEPSSESYSNL